LKKGKDIQLTVKSRKGVPALFLFLSRVRIIKNFMLAPL